MTRHWQRLLSLLFAFALVAAACGGSDEVADGETTDETAATETTAPPQAGDEAEGDVDTAIEETEGERAYGGTVAVGLEAEATGLRPWEDNCSSSCYNMMSAIYDKLVEQTVDGTYEGFLFESIESNEDFTSWVGTLRPGVTFHNGVELTAQTIVDMFALQQTGAAGGGGISASNLDDVQATGDLEVTYTLSRANSAFPAFLGRSPLGIVFEPAAAAADPEGFSDAPVGTGPFILESRDLDNETVVVRNENYWMTDPEGNQLPFLDSIVFRPIPDEGTRLDALLSGTVNAMTTLRQGTIRDARAAVEDGADVTLYEHQGNNLGGGHFNVLVPPFDDKRVRNGLVHLNPVDQVLEALGGSGISLPATQWFSPDSPWYSEAVAEAWPKFDFERGVELITEYVNDPERSDGKAVGEPLTFEQSCPPDPTLVAALTVVIEIYDATGLIEAEVTNYDQQTHINYALGADNGFVGEHGAHCWRFSNEDDPSVGLNEFLAPPTAEIAEAAGLPGVVSPRNFSNWFDPESFEAAVAATQTDDFDERYALYETIMLRIAEETPIWYNDHTATAIGTESNVLGLNSWHLPSGSIGIGFPRAEGRWHEVWIG